jgi:hypothetical protein
MTAKTNTSEPIIAQLYANKGVFAVNLEDQPMIAPDYTTSDKISYVN